jgi:ADP-ribosylglycohydrolase
MDDARRDRVLGSVLGGAIGDALGHPTEFLDTNAIRARWGEAGVTDYVLFWDDGGERFAPYTDDTQMAEQVLRGLLEGRDEQWGLDETMQAIGRRFVQWMVDPQGGHRAPGNACLAGCRALQGGIPWREAGGEQAGGCGSVMRAHPFGLVFADDPPRAEAWAVAHSALTHRDPIALAACAAMAVGVAGFVRGEPLDRVLDDAIAAALRWDATTAGMMGRARAEARAGVGPEQTLDRLRSWAAHEAIAAAIYLTARHPDDSTAAMLEGANAPGDSDSIASMAGALLGARCGASALRSDWIERLERTVELQLLARAI